MAIAKKVAPWQHFVSVNGSQEVDLLKPNWGAVNSKQLVFGIFWVSGYSPDYTTHFRTIQFLVLSNFQIGSDAWYFLPASCRVQRLLRWWRAAPRDDTLGGSGGERYQNSWWFTETVCSTWILAITLCGSASPPHHCLNYVPPIVYLFGQMPPYLGLWSF